MDLSSAIPTFVITLREGVEAALVIGIVLAYLNKANRRNLRGWVWGGVAVGLAASGMIGALFGWMVEQAGAAGSSIEQFLEASFSVLAIACLSWMLIWMTRNARSLKQDVEGAIGSVLKQDAQAGWGIFGLVFFAVVREGFETVLFITGKFQQGLFPAIGAISGIGVAALIGILLFRWGIRLNLRKFFMVMGVLLLLIVSGLVVTALGHFDAGMSALASVDRKSASICFFYERFAKPQDRDCVLGGMVWNFSKVLPAEQFPGSILSTLFGYTDRLYLVQAVAYVVFLFTVGSLYFQSLLGRSWFSLRRTSKQN
ncbi:FTR1 family protein [Cyanobacteria bacterium FACHB-63]|nr:FTR1 family protein [Cyanobacteria bacterium FACHB-63]